MDPNTALVALLNAVEKRDFAAYWEAIDELHQSSAHTGKIAQMPPGVVTFAPDELKALNTCCQLEMGQKKDDRIAAWREIDSAQNKILQAMRLLEKNSAT